MFSPVTQAHRPTLRYVHSSVFAFHKHCGAGEKVGEDFQLFKSVVSLAEVLLAWSVSPYPQMVACVTKDRFLHADPLWLKDRIVFLKSEGKTTSGKGHRRMWSSRNSHCWWDPTRHGRFGRQVGGFLQNGAPSYRGVRSHAPSGPCESLLHQHVATSLICNC